MFIDEAGGFQTSPIRSRVSAVAALLVPESVARGLFRRFRRLSRPWKRGKPEVKGSQLDEAQAAQVIAAVRRYDVLLVAVAIDMAMHSASAVQAHKVGQAAKIRASKLPGMPKHRLDEFEARAARTEALPDQLYVQSVLLTTLVDAVVRVGSLYYVQRIPKTLGNFAWRIDEKDPKKITTYEALWQEVVRPYLQTISLSKPHMYLDEADYSWFDRYARTEPEAPAHLRKHLRKPRTPFETPRYRPTAQRPQILLVRACNGNPDHRRARVLHSARVQRELRPAGMVGPRQAHAEVGEGHGVRELRSARRHRA